ncbi:hypothetical protein CAPTEDRAFT_203978 [Capitella teleta]|uniref:Inositolphosphotransferase Aur1/Ipt1 domain-containing protein n=1 Tax=Capitella teleta TaxID=283909 RepID=R7V3E4_CAPTE|nr:hypothetical protein CAPTEDRAFT_203978 [Capitella teleta]|eukprot:ELU10320.1 hypothetical protein CAPTEDRAFT_203978 [Capitella teleta]
MAGIKQMNGSVANGSAALAGLKPVTVTSGYSQFITILKSTIPYLAFLFLYGINQQVHILPKFDDLDCIHLYNMSAIEFRIWHFLPHKLVSSLHTPFLDVMAAIPYLMHYVIPILYPLYLYCRGQVEFISKFYWLLGWCMWFMFIIWFFFPTAPPWTYDNLELFQRMNYTTMPPYNVQHKEGCAFHRLDEMTGIHFFFGMFSGNPVPFASFPSGHVSWPACIYATLPPGGRLFSLYVLWVAWATLYSCHHYLLDAVMAVIIVTGVRRLLVWLAERPSRNRDSTCGFQGVVCPLNMV